MCIRDRLYTDEAILMDVMSGNAAGLPGFLSFEPYIEWIQGCLLYTSDAADERSSVDLGGRRIIKKKINVQASYHQANSPIHIRNIAMMMIIRNINLKNMSTLQE